MESRFKKDLETRDLIKKETILARIVGFSCLTSTVIYALIAYFVKVRLDIDEKLLNNLWQIFSIVVVFIMLISFAIRRSFYYSPRLIKKDYSLEKVLAVWKKLDISLLTVAEIIPILGLLLNLFGMPFEQTYFFFAGGFLFIILLIPMGIKVRSRLTTLKQQNPDLNF